MFGLSYIIFRFVNFFIVIIAASCYAKKKLSPLAKEMMKSEQERIAQFDQTYAAIKEAQSAISNQIVDDKKIMEELLAKLDLWREAYVRTIFEKKKMEQLYQDQMNRHMQLRAEKIAEEQLCNEVVVGALADVRKELEIKFMSEKEGQLFLKTLTSALQDKA